MVDANRSLSNLIGPCHVLSPLVASPARLHGLYWLHGMAWHGWTGRCPCSARLSSSPPTHGCVGCSASSSASIDLPLGPGPLLVQLLHRRPRLLRSYGPRRLLLSGRTSSSPWPGFAVVRAGVASFSRHRDRGGHNSAQLLLLLSTHIVPSLCAIILFMDHPCDLYLYGCSRRPPAPLANPLCPCPSIPPTAHNRSGSVSSGSPS